MKEYVIIVTEAGHTPVTDESRVGLAETIRDTLLRVTDSDGKARCSEVAIVSTSREGFELARDQEKPVLVFLSGSMENEATQIARAHGKHIHVVVLTGKDEPSRPTIIHSSWLGTRESFATHLLR